MHYVDQCDAVTKTRVLDVSKSYLKETTSEQLPNSVRIHINTCKFATRIVIKSRKIRQ